MCSVINSEYTEDQVQSGHTMNWATPLRPWVTALEITRVILPRIGILIAG